MKITRITLPLKTLVLFQILLFLFCMNGLSGCSGCRDNKSCSNAQQAPTANAGPDQTYTLSPGNITLDVTLDGSLSSACNGSIDSYVWTGNPDPEDVENPIVSLPFGTHVFSLVVTDNQGLESVADSVTITILAPVAPAERHAPEIVLESTSYEVEEGARLEIPLSASDPDNEPVSLSMATVMANVQFTATPGNQATGLFVSQPNYDQQGTHVVVFSARDPFGIKTSRAVTIRVNNVNRPPAIDMVSEASVDEGGLLTVSIIATDPDKDILSYSADPVPNNAVFVPSVGSLTFMPDFTQAGTYPLTVTVTDGNTPVSGNLTLTVNDVPTGEPGQPGELILDVDDPENPSFLSSVSVTGAVNPGPNTPPGKSMTSALITGLSPATGKQGQTLNVSLTGNPGGDHETHFAQGISSAVFGGNITVNSLAITSPTQATANITIAKTAATGPRLVTLTTGNETAISIIGFNVTQGSTTVTGKLVSDSGQPITNAVVMVQGTLIQTLSLADGTFTLLEVPSGPRTLIVNAPDHELTRVNLDGAGGTEVALADLEILATVFDPDTEPGVSIHSILNRGIGDITGNVTIGEAAQMIVDAILCAGGNEAGVLDAYGNQLNPSVDGLGKTSLTNQGVNLYAQRMSMGQSTTLMEVFMEISFAFAWDPAPPTFKELLDGMQSIVNHAWNDPNDPASRLPILLFNRGETLNPNPPVLEANTRLSLFQAYLAVNSFMTTLYNHQDEWKTVSGLNRSDKNAALAFFRKTGLNLLLSPKAAWADDPPGVYTITWENLISSTSAIPTGPGTSTGSPVPPTLPAFEDLLKKYYLDLSEESLTKARELLMTTFPAAFTTANLDDIFKNDPYAVKIALEKLINIGATENDIANLLGQIASRDEKGEAGTLNLWGMWEVERGKAVNNIFQLDILPIYFPSGVSGMPTMLFQAMPPSAPNIYSAEDATDTLTTSAGNIVLPSAKLVFYPSSDDKLAKNPADWTFVYRLWRTEKGTKKIKDSTGKDTTQKYDLTLAGYGTLGEDKRLAPTMETDASGNPTKRYYFNIPLPPPGMNNYRIDCILFKGDKTMISKITPTELQTKLTPWLSGYLDDVSTWDPTGTLTREQVHPAKGVVRNLIFETSPMSENMSVYISGKAAGLTTFGKTNLVADYKNNEKVYVSIPAYKTTAHGDRGTGSIFRYDGNTGDLEEYTRPGFITPGQTGLALDKKSNLYTENAATEAAYGGKIFRMLGYRSVGEAAYAPKYPNPNPKDAAAAVTGTTPNRLFVGTVNYYSMLVNRANPVGLVAMAMGGVSTRDLGEELYVADAMGSGKDAFSSGGKSSQIKRVAVQAPELKNYESGHNVGEIWAWNDLSDTASIQQDQDHLDFGPLTDMTFDTTQSRLFITQGDYVIQAQYGKNASFSITKNGTLFTSTAGCAVCESNGDEYLFVADRAEGRILKIPFKDLTEPVTGKPDVKQLVVPVDQEEKDRLINRYTFYKDLDRPDQIRITDNGAAMVVSDNYGFRYLRFGFTSRVLDTAGQPLIGAVVTIKTLAGERSTTTDGEGYYQFLETDTYSVIADISHPDWSFSQRILVSGKCDYTTDMTPHPCVVITEPADESLAGSDSVLARGTIFPKDVDFSQSGGTLEVITPMGKDIYDLSFTGSDNDFVVANVKLGMGTNHLIARTFKSSLYEAGGSLVSSITRTSATITTQAISGIAADLEGNPLPGVVVEILVDGDLAETTESDACGYYNAQNLPLGTLTVNVIE